MSANQTHAISAIPPHHLAVIAAMVVAVAGPGAKIASIAEVASGTLRGGTARTPVRRNPRRSTGRRR